MMLLLQHHRLVELLSACLLACFCLFSCKCAAAAVENDNDGHDWQHQHSDPNNPNENERYDGMIYVGRYHSNITPSDKEQHYDHHDDNGIVYIFGTSFDETHKELEEEELLKHHRDHHHNNDLADRNHATKTRQEVLNERRHTPVSQHGPKPFGHVDEHELDGGMVPPKVVHVDPFFMDAHLVTNGQYAKFVRSTHYETEAEHFGWSFVLESFLSSSNSNSSNSGDEQDDLNVEVDPEAEHWVAVHGAYWKKPEGPKSLSHKHRLHHPVVHVSHKDAAEYCAWEGKRLPGEREWEAAARAGHWGPSNRTMYVWGDDGSNWTLASQYANLWGNGSFPFENLAQDGWRGTSPVGTYPPNRLGFYDMTGNVWEWMRGGKHKKRIVRGGSYVDSMDASVNHAATLGARATLHGTTTTANVGFRCVKSPKRKTEYHYVSHDEAVHGKLEIEDEYGNRVPQPGWEDVFRQDELWMDEYDPDDPDMIKPDFKLKKVVKERTRISSEL